MRLKLRRRHSSELERDEPGPDYMSWILGHVSATGWAIPGVPGYRGTPPWAYSIGLWATYGQPDLAAFSRPLGELAVILRALCQRVADGEPVEAGDEISGAGPARLAVRDVHDSWRTTSLFHCSDRFHGYIRPPFCQVVWADPGGNFPWDRAFEPALADAQPRLWLPVDDHPPGPWTRLSRGA